MKPNHEVGASRLLSFAKPAAPVKTAPKADVWTLEDIEDDTVELMDDSELLNEEDLVKPDPASLRVCGTTGEQRLLMLILINEHVQCSVYFYSVTFILFQKVQLCKKQLSQLK